MQAVHFLLLAVVAEPADVEAATLLRSHGRRSVRQRSLTAEDLLSRRYP